MKDKKVLIVDFDDKSIGPLTKFLEEEGFEVLVERDGEAGLETTKKEKPDLVILEPMLPKLHGFELCSIITHDLEPKIPVIILTKFYREEQFKIESVRSFGASAFVSKPFQGSDMRKMLKDMLPTEEEEKPEAEELDETEIPESLSDDALTDLQPDKIEDPQPEEIKAPEKIVQEKDLSLEKDIFKPAAEIPQKKEKTPERDIGQDIDAILQDTLTEFTQKKTEVEPGPETSVPLEDPFQSFIPDAKPFVPESRPDSTFPDLMPAEPDIKVSQMASISPLVDLDSLRAEPQVTPPAKTAPELDPEKIEKPKSLSKPEETSKSQDAIFQKFDEMAQAAQPPKPIEEIPAPEPAVESPKEVLQKAEAVTQTLEKELEIKVVKMVDQESDAATAIPKPNKSEKKKKSVQVENSKAPVEKTDADVPPVEDTTADDKNVDEPALPELKDVVEKDDMFAGFGSPEENKAKPNIIQAILSKIKGTPKKYIVPIAAVFMITLVSLVFMIPKLSKDTPAEQASLGMTLEGKTKAPPEETTSEPVELSQEDPQDSTTAFPPVPAEGEEEDPAIDPLETPQPKPEAKSTPPPNLPLVEEDLRSSGESSQLMGNTTPALNQDPPAETSREQDQATEEQPSAKPPAAKQETPPPAKENLLNSEATDPAVSEAETELPPVMKRMPDKAKQGDIVSIKAVDTEPEVIKQELPRYPAVAKGRGIAGTVLINTLISENGDVLQTVVTRKINSTLGFNEAAERAVKKWKFRPAWKDGVRVKVWKTIPIAFRENSD